MATPDRIDAQLARLDGVFSVSTAKLKAITERFVTELAKGLSVEGGDIPMNPTWVTSYPSGHETGEFLALDLGGTNLRVCRITLSEEKSAYSTVQQQFQLPGDLRTRSSEELWDYIADCLSEFVDKHYGDSKELGKLPLGFTFSYPVTQNHIDEGVLQRWTKGFDIDGVEGHDVVPMLEAALAKRGVPIRLIALINDTTGTLVASTYTDPKMKIGAVYGTGCNGAYMEDCAEVPKLADKNLPAGTEMIINCEWGAFDSENKVLPRSSYDEIVDKESPRPGQQAYEKMIAGHYLGEIARLVLLDLNEKAGLFNGQDISGLEKPHSFKSSFLSALEKSGDENLGEVGSLIAKELNLTCSKSDLEVLRRLAELIGTRAARLFACSIAAVCKRKKYSTCHVGVDGSAFDNYPQFRPRAAQALREILDWPDSEGGEGDPVEILAAADGSGLGAALIASLTVERVGGGDLAGILHPENFVIDGQA